MARRSDLLAQLVRYGVRYAPLAYEGLKRGKGPAAEFAQARLTRRNARTMALEHAAHLRDGSILPVYDGDTRVWVVFSGEEVVGTHPVTRTPLDALLRHYDLAKRIRPGAASRRLPAIPGRRPGRRTTNSDAGGGTSPAVETPRPIGPPRGTVEPSRRPEAPTQTSPNAPYTPPTPAASRTPSA